jgi:hypothetical protein
MLQDLLDILKMFLDNTEYTKDTKLAEFGEHPLYNSDFLTSLFVLESIYFIFIPNELAERNDLTLEGFVKEVELLPKISDRLWAANRMMAYAICFGHRQSSSTLLN